MGYREDLDAARNRRRALLREVAPLREQLQELLDQETDLRHRVRRVRRTLLWRRALSWLVGKRRLKNNTGGDA